MSFIGSEPSDIFAATNALYASYLSRVREVGTLLAIGFTRRRVMTLLLQESVVLAVIGGLLGFLASMAIHGRNIYFADMGVFYTAQVSTEVIAAEAAIAALIGLLGGLATMLQAYRTPILVALSGD